MQRQKYTTSTSQRGNPLLSSTRPRLGIGHGLQRHLVHLPARKAHAAEFQPATQQAVLQAEVLDPSSGCPVLRQLKPLPRNNMGLLETNFLLATDFSKFQERLYGEQDVATGLLGGLFPAVFLGSNAAIKDALSHELSGSLTVGMPSSAQKLLGYQSLASITNPEKYRALRKLMQPAFSNEAIDCYLPDLQRIVRATLNRWADTCDKGVTILAVNEVKLMTFQIICYAALDMELTGKELQETSDDFTEWIENLISIAPIDAWPFPFNKSMNARRRLLARIKKRVVTVRQQLEEGAENPTTSGIMSKKKQPSILIRLLTARDEQGNALTEEQILDNLLLMLFAGHDTSSSQLTTLLYELAKHPKVMERVRVEQAQVISKHGPDMTPAALRDMKYTGAVLQEVLRVRPIVGSALRTATQDVDIAGYQVPKGKVLALNYGKLMHADPRWPASEDPKTDPFHPNNFNPDRFLTEEGLKQGVQYPFGAGQRSCLGIGLAQAEAKVFLANLARGFKLFADKKTGYSFTPFPTPNNKLPIFIDKL